MTTVADPQHLAYLRNLPSGYLLDLLAVGEGVDEASVQWVLRERGFTPEEVTRKVERRRHSSLPRRTTLWTIARWTSLVNTLIILIFNGIALSQLLQSEDVFKPALVFLAMLCAGFGFFLGFKLTTHIYQGAPSRLFCGFPVPIGYVELETGEATSTEGAALIMRMAVNAIVGVNITLFPIMLIYLVMH